MAFPGIDQDVIDAVLAGTARITRRLEIYEADGTTLWMPSENTPRMISGAVSVDYDRDERRSIDLVLDNSDGILNHDPNNFWYDKVLKVYRGVEFPNTRRTPRILVINDGPAAGTRITPWLRSIGFTDVTQDPNASTIEDLAGYDIIVAYSGYVAITAAQGALLDKAFKAGYNVFTGGNDNTQATVPLIASVTAKGTNEGTATTLVSSDLPFRRGVAAALGSDADTGSEISTLRSDAKVAANDVWLGNTYPSLIYAESSAGGRWFHWQRPYTVAATPNRKLLFKNIFEWLYSYAEYRNFEVQLGEFYIDRISEPSFPRNIKVTGRDGWKKLLGAKFHQSVTFAAGQQLDALVTSIAANAGITKRRAEATGITLSSTISIDRTAERGKAIKDICSANGVEVFFDAAGYLVTRPFRDPVTSPTGLTLKTGEDGGNLVSYEKASSDARIYNVIVVTGENSDELAVGHLYQAVARNEEPSSPTRVTGKLGERTYFYTSSFFTSQEQCQAVADSLLKTKALEEYELSFSSLVFPWLEGGDIVEFVDPSPGVDEPDRFLLTNFSIPVTLGPMSGSGKRVTVVGSPTAPGTSIFDEEFESVPF